MHFHTGQRNPPVWLQHSGRKGASKEMYQFCKNFAGSTTIKVLPAPGVLLQDTVPPWRSVMALTMASPRPLPVAEPGVLAEETV